MKFTVISHAGLMIEHRGTSILMDPWLIGSCYWRSWWNYPEPDPQLLEELRPDYIYLTHLHWDHFHGPSLRKFNRRTKLLVPEIHTRRMVEDLRWMEFSDITEVPHAAKISLGEDFEMSSYQFGPAADSAVILSGGGTTIFNANDCKLFGYPLRRILRAHPRIDFVLRSYSSASAIPYCIEGYERRWPQLRSREDYIEEFGQFAMHVGARWAIPFASNHCFLHEQTIRFNNTTVSPVAAADSLNARAAELGRETRAVVMPSGSSWSDAGGFSIREFDYERKKEYIAELLFKHAGKLEQTKKEEAAVRADLPAFRAYFEKALAAIPGWLPRVRSLRVTFEVQDSAGTYFWFVDFGKGIVKELDAADPESLVVALDAALLNDCTTKWMFSTLGPSKRLRFRVPEHRTWFDVRLFLSVLDAYELELLPLSKHFSRRHLSIWARRWPELVELIRVVIEHKVLKRPFKIVNLYPLPG